MSRPVAVLGPGELGATLVAALAPRASVRVWGRSAGPWQQAAAAAGAAAFLDLAPAVRDAQVVLACVVGTAVTELAEAVAPRLSAGAVYADLATAAPEAKAAAAEVVAAAGGRYADGAVLGTVVASGAAVPVIASGPGARALAAVAPELGLQVTVVAGPAGTAARVKLLRSVYLKGRDALVAEMLLAADRYDVADAVLGSIRGPGEEVAFPALAERISAALTRHAARRADELAAAAAVLRAVGVEPAATDGAQRRLRLLSGGSG